MSLSFMTRYFVPVVVVFCLCVGYLLHNVVRNEKLNRWIPVIVALVGVFVSCLSSGVVRLELIVAGMVSGIAATGFYEAFNQLINKGGLAQLERSGFPGHTKDGE